jgi:hypothetical protein
VSPRKPPPKSSGVSDRIVSLVADRDARPPEFGLPCARHTPLVRTADGPRGLSLWGPGSPQSGAVLEAVAGPCAQCFQPLDEETAERCLAEWRELLAATRKRLEEECAREEAT